MQANINSTNSSTADDLCAALLTPREHHHRSHYFQHTDDDNNNNSTQKTTVIKPGDAAAAAQRAMSWKPAFDRRQSWDKQEYKHEVQKREWENVKEDRKRGFTETDAVAET